MLVVVVEDEDDDGGGGGDGLLVEGVVGRENIFFSSSWNIENEIFSVVKYRQNETL